MGRIELPKLCDLMSRNARIFCISYYQRTTFKEITQNLEYDTIKQTGLPKMASRSVDIFRSEN